MNERPLISILTPVFNQGLYIEQTIRSVLNQTYQNWEWVIIDDGSTDNTAEIICKHKDSRIKYTFQQHAGRDCLTKTFNKALTMSRGSLIAMLDGDDYWPHDKLEIQLDKFNDTNVVLSYGEACVVNQQGRKISYMDLPEDNGIASNNPVGSALNILLFKRYCFIPNSTVMFRRSAITNIGGFIEAPKMLQDFPTWTMLSLEGKFAAIPSCLGYWRRHPLSTNLNCGPEILFDAGIDFLRHFILTNQ